LSGSTASKRTEKRAGRLVFVPQTMGIFVLLLTTLAFIAGGIRRELALTLTGAVFLAVWAYCLAMCLLFLPIHQRRAGGISPGLSPREIRLGEDINVRYGRLSFPVPPGILIRYRLRMSTRDGRLIQHDFNPAKSFWESLGPIPFLPRKKIPPHGGAIRPAGRGVYFSVYDEFAVLDALGFFRFVRRLPQGAEPRLIVCPQPAGEAIPLSAPAGGTEKQSERRFQRSDNLIDHRPYIPGDDPRRINWKLYGHGGELFVREGEPEPPPHSNILIMIDAEYDPLLYSVEAARRGLDLLCENALAAALAWTGSGMDARIAYAGSAGFPAAVPPAPLQGNSPAELASALAWPAAYPLGTRAELPAAPGDWGVLILALPRTSAESSALDRFLKQFAGRGAGHAKTAELVFLYAAGEAQGPGGELAAAAETCAALYRQRAGLRARAAAG
jgi:hypothetical protein